eukprot:TRINITY_DN6949_c0_g1_i1.p1 TRINITY_DN6949_c0_g1~~TRINITY_DN6949_c0_g1_i1.p1  ORF type:complete len:221 (-),score=25.59 TRINITY_DN6949_c0_g1_i1:200-862(-)
MTETFDRCERHYCELSTTLARKCSQLGAAQGELKKQKLQELNNGLDEAESLIRKMEKEAQTLLPVQKFQLIAKLREYKSDLNSLKRDAKNFSANDSISTRDDLLESGQRMLATAADQRTRLLVATDKLNQSSERIKESKRTLLETEQLGVSILHDLHSQRQILVHAQDTLHEVDNNIVTSRKLLTSMGRRLNRNQYALWGIIAVLIFAILLILYYKFTGH